MRMIHVLRKPLSEGTVAANTLKHGTGGINIAASRISTTDNLNGGAYAENASERHDGAENWRYKRGEQGNAGEYQPPSGRWPANVILQHLDGCRCDGTKRVTGTTKLCVRGVASGNVAVYSKGIGDKKGQVRREYGGVDGKESVANWICEPGCPVVRLDEQSGDLRARGNSGPSGGGGGMYGHGKTTNDFGAGDMGGASRFFKQVGDGGSE